MGSQISVIIPTLNERLNIGVLLDDISRQDLPPSEVICMDGGSVDGTQDVARRHGATVSEKIGESEIDGMNRGARASGGKILLFVSADVRMSTDALLRISTAFLTDHQLVAITGRPLPSDASTVCMAEYTAYNCAKRIFAFLPKEFRRFIPSSSFLAVSREAFDKAGGFRSGHYNSDGRLGFDLARLGHTRFQYDLVYRISPRRYDKLGFLEFTRQFIYVFENFFPMLSTFDFFRSLGHDSMILHQDTGQRVTARKE